MNITDDLNIAIGHMAHMRTALTAARGSEAAGDRAALCEDLLTAAGASIEAANALHEAAAKVMKEIK